MEMNIYQMVEEHFEPFINNKAVDAKGAEIDVRDILVEALAELEAVGFFKEASAIDVTPELVMKAQYDGKITEANICGKREEFLIKKRHTNQYVGEYIIRKEGESYYAEIRAFTSAQNDKLRKSCARLRRGHSTDFDTQIARDITESLWRDFFKGVEVDYPNFRIDTPMDMWFIFASMVALSKQIEIGGLDEDYLDFIYDFIFRVDYPRVLVGAPEAFWRFRVYLDADLGEEGAAIGSGLAFGLALRPLIEDLQLLKFSQRLKPLFDYLESKGH